MNYLNDVHRKNAYIENQVRPSVRLSVDMFNSTVYSNLMQFDTKFVLFNSTLDLNFDFSQSATLDRNSSVGIAARYRLEGPGIESH